MQLEADFSDASEVKNFVDLKGYFQGSLHKLNDALSGVVHHDLALHALGGLANHLSRMMVSAFILVIIVTLANKSFFV